MPNIYRVTARTTSSLQPGATYWQTEVLFCGTDKTAALVEFYRSKPGDYWQGYGNRVRETEIEAVDADAVEDVTDPPPMQAFEAS